MKAKRFFYRRVGLPKSDAWVSLEFVPGDMWIGLFWRRKHPISWNRWEFFICILPCFPIRIEWMAYDNLPEVAT